MDFGDAIRAMKRGALVRRQGWNGKGMYLWLQCDMAIRLSGLPGDAAELPLQDAICMRTAQDTVCVGWLASQADMLSEDWEVAP